MAASISTFVAIYFFIKSEKETHKVLSGEKKLKELLLQDKAKLLSVITSLTDGVIVLDSNLTPWVVNDSARSFLSITKSSPSFSDIHDNFPESIKIGEKITEALSLNRLISIHDVKIKDKTFELFINPVENTKQGGSPIGISVLLQDMTYEKSLEKMRDEFSHVVVHELRAPLAAIKDAASMMVKEDLDKEDQSNMLRLIHDQSYKLLNQVGTILDAAKIEDGKLKLNKTMGDIGKIAKEEVELFLAEAKRKQITLIAEIGNDIPKSAMDTVRIAQVINNLLSNSLKYTNEQGTVRLMVDADEEYKRHTGEGSILISVSDTGMGIPDDKKQTLFTKFGQINLGSEGTQKISSGLGLYITKGIVKSHGGSIDLKSQVGKGTTITITLPISSEINDDNSVITASVKTSLGSNTESTGLPPHPTHVIK